MLVRYTDLTSSWPASPFWSRYFFWMSIEVMMVLLRPYRFVCCFSLRMLFCSAFLPASFANCSFLHSRDALSKPLDCSAAFFLGVSRFIFKNSDTISANLLGSAGNLDEMRDTAVLLEQASGLCYIWCTRNWMQPLFLQSLLSLPIFMFNPFL